MSVYKLYLSLLVELGIKQNVSIKSLTINHNNQSDYGNILAEMHKNLFVLFSSI